MRIVNWDIIKHPVNWFTVILMVVIAGFAAHYILKWETSP